MLIAGLAWKYFQQNKEKTYRALIILMLNLSVVVASDLLTNGFINQIENFTALAPNQDERYLTVFTGSQSNPELFSPDVIGEIETILINSRYVNDYIPFYLTISNISFNSVLIGNSNMMVVNTTKWFEYNKVNIHSRSGSTNLFCSNLLELNPNFQYKVSNLENEILFTNFTVFSDLLYRTPEILMDYNFISYYNQINFTNGIQIQLSIIGDGTELIEELSIFEDLIFDFPNQRDIFLINSASQLITILTFLQISMFFILIPSISYVILNLFLEIKSDIRILNQLGVSKFKSILLLESIVLIISLLASLLAIYFSLLIINILATLIVLLTPLPFIVTSVSPIIIILVFTQSIVTGVLVSIIPLSKVIN